MQCIEHLGKHSMIWNSAHRKLLTIAEANVQHISTFSICEDVWHFSQRSYNITINSHNGQLTLHTESHASDSGAVHWERRKILGANPNYCIVKYLYLKNHLE
jgi:hypothetical protein